MMTHFYSLSIGGVEKVVTHLSGSLKSHNINIIAERRLNLERKDLKTKGVYQFSYPHKRILGLLNIWNWIWIHRRLIGDADIIHIHDVFIWYLPFRFLFPNKPVYMTFHGWEGTYPIPLKSLIQKKLAYYLCKRNICVGHYLEKYYGIKGNIVSYGATDIPDIEHKKIKDSFIYIGRLSQDTGLPLVLQTISELKNINIQFCGDGALKKECKKYGKVHGIVKDPWKYAATAEFYFAGGYLSILEGLASKCMVCVTYDNPLKEDCFKKAPFAKYIIIAGSSEELLRKISYYQNHRAEMKKKIQAGYIYAKKQSWEKLGDQYLQLWGIKN